MNTQTVESTRAHCFSFASSEKSQASPVDVEQSQPRDFLRFAMSMNKFCGAILGLDRVIKIGFKARGESISAWTFVNDPTHETLAKIYAAEMELMNANPNMLFDFAVKFDDTPEPLGFYIVMGQ